MARCEILAPLASKTWPSPLPTCCNHSLATHPGAQDEAVRQWTEGQSSRTLSPPRQGPFASFILSAEPPWWDGEPQESPGLRWSAPLPPSPPSPFLSGEHPWLIKGISFWSLPNTPTQVHWDPELGTGDLGVIEKGPEWYPGAGPRSLGLSRAEINCSHR